MPANEEILERIARLEIRMDDVREDLAIIREQIDGPPRDSSIRGRLHKIESSESAAKAAEAALAATRALREHDLSTKVKFLLAAVALVTLFCTIATTVLALGNHERLDRIQTVTIISPRP